MCAELQSFEEIEREQISLSGKVFGPIPVGRLYGLLRLIEEAANFVDHVLLRVVEIAAISAVQILLGGSYVLVGLLLEL
jgi:hypothetical protein